MNIPEGLPTDIIESLTKERSIDCCYTCYTLYEATQNKVAEVSKDAIKKGT
jgi:hypothetical protein